MAVKQSAAAARREEPAAAASKPKLARISPAQAAVTNTLLRATPARVVHEDQTYRIDASVAGGVPALAAGDEWAATVHCSGSGVAAAAAIDMSQYLIDQTTASASAPVDLLKLPPWLRLAVAAAAGDPLLRAVEAAAGFTITLIGVEPLSPGSGPAAPALRLTRMADDTVLGAIRARGAAPQWLGLALREYPVVRHHPRLARAPLQVGLPPVGVRVSELRGLRVGDVLLSDSREEYAVRLGGRPVGTAHSQDQLAYQLTRLTMATSGEPEGDAEGPVPANEVNVEVGFDIGHSWISLEEMAALQPGYVFNIEGGDINRVRIRAGGQILGTGELVRVGERLGVRLLEISHGVDGLSQ